MAAVAVKVVVATGMFEVEELQKNCREFEGGTGFSAEAGFCCVVNRTSVRLKYSSHFGVAGACCAYQVLADILPFPLLV